MSYQKRTIAVRFLQLIFYLPYTYENHLFFEHLLLSPMVFAQTGQLNNNPLKTSQDAAVHRAAINYMRDGTAHGLIIASSKMVPARFTVMVKAV